MALGRCRARLSLLGPLPPRGLWVPASLDCLGFPEEEEMQVAYVLGQVQSPEAVPALTAALADTRSDWADRSGEEREGWIAEENEMVRHEAAEALGSIGGAEAEAILAQYAKVGEGSALVRSQVDRRVGQDGSRVVAESVEVALDIADVSSKPFSPLITA